MEGASAILANGRYYGGKFVAAPGADLAAPSLELVLFRRGGRLAALRYALALAAGRLHRLRDVAIVRAHRVEIHGAAGEPIQADGDIVAMLPARIETAPETLAVRVPRG
jgi:diacylglycerol kinase family enzyme